MDRPDPLSVDALYTRCEPEQLPFETTDQVDELDGVIGQKRALDALHFGTGISSQGYNMYALGTAGTGKFTAVNRILSEEASKRPPPDDWCYVYNFQQPHKPNALRLPAGRGSKFRADMEQLIEDLSTAIPSAFETEDYHSRVEKIEKEATEQRDKALNDLAEEATRHNVRFLHTPAGFAFAPLDEKGDIIRPDTYEKLPDSDKQRIEQTVEGLQKQLQRIIRQIPIWQKEAREKVKELDREFARYAVDHLIGGIKERYQDLSEVVQYLKDAEVDIVEHVREFRGESEPQAVVFGGPGKAEALQRYKVNVMVDNSGDQAAPVVYEDLPTHSNLVGKVEYRAQMGTLVTDFTLIKAGDLHRANGGYLILDAVRVLTQPFAWEGLKRSLRSREIRIEPLEKMYGLISTVSLEPEPIPLDVKVVLVGERRLYYLLCLYDPEFQDLFKVAADFDDRMDRDDESHSAFARLLASIVKQNSLQPLDRDAVARVIEHSARLADDSEKLSIHLRSLSDLLHEADYWARAESRPVTGRDDIQRAIDAKEFRLDRVRAYVYEAIRRGTLKIDTAGERIAQINALSVIDLGEFSFGQPSRVTATVRLGDGRVIDIQRETKLGGKIHSKGVLILSNYLSSHYATDHPLSMAASLVFEQSYGMVEGDSASLAELCALLSALARLPIRQSLALTGSVNQLGEVQAIGGVNQKIEGFFDVCQAGGLTGEQGVVIPRSNVPHLMLRHDVVQAVADGKFEVYAAETADEAMSLLTAMSAGERDSSGAYPPDSINGRVEKTLIDLAVQKRRFSKQGDEKSDEARK